ncbi:MAG: hypothetical protein R3242_04735 [Akkermansiaceae bacterium]|nr:hypothetical protein [Akkermansiaceae bacterium]
MKTIITILLLIASQAFVQARSFSYSIYVYGVEGETKVDITSELPVTKKENLSIAEAIKFLESAPQSSSLTRIAILEDFGGNASQILDHVNKNPTMMLAFYQGFSSEAMKQNLYKLRDDKKKQAESGPRE